MKKININILTDIPGYLKGQIDRFWRRRFHDATIDNSIEVAKKIESVKLKPSGLNNEPLFPENINAEHFVKKDILSREFDAARELAIEFDYKIKHKDSKYKKQEKII